MQVQSQMTNYSAYSPSCKANPAVVEVVKDGVEHVKIEPTSLKQFLVKLTPEKKEALAKASLAQPSIYIGSCK